MRASVAAAATSVSSVPQQVSPTVTVQPVQTSDEDRCPHCGAVTLKWSKFCKSCGKSRLPSELPPSIAPPTRARVPAPAPITRPTHALPATRPPSAKSKKLSLFVTGTVLVLVLGAGGVAYWRLVYRNKPQQANATANTPNPPAGPTNPQAQAEATGEVTANQASGSQTAPIEAQAPSGGSEAELAAPSPTQSKNRSSTSGGQPAAPAPPPYQQAHTNAEQAFAAAQYIDPPNNSALYWARMAIQQGDPSALQIEQQVLEQMKTTVQAQRASRNYDSAIMLQSRLMQLFPDRTELQQMGSSIADEQQAYSRQLEQQRKAEEFKAQSKEFSLQHRHVLGLQGFQPVYSYCEGVLRITPDGIARFDCTRGDARGRCDHLSFTASDLRDIQLKKDGMLHLAGRSGNADFQADAATIQGALDALRNMKSK